MTFHWFVRVFFFPKSVFHPKEVALNISKKVIDSKASSAVHAATETVRRVLKYLCLIIELLFTSDVPGSIWRWRCEMAWFETFTRK